MPADLPFAEQVDVDPSEPVLIALSDAHKAQEKEALDAVGKRESPFTTLVGPRTDPLTATSANDRALVSCRALTTRPHSGPRQRVKGERLCCVELS